MSCRAPPSIPTGSLEIAYVTHGGWKPSPPCWVREALQCLLWLATLSVCLCTANDDVLCPFVIAAMGFGERRGLQVTTEGGKECGAVRSHFPSLFSPCKGHSSRLAFVADL